MVKWLNLIYLPLTFFSYILVLNVMEQIILDIRLGITATVTSMYSPSIYVFLFVFIIDPHPDLSSSICTIYTTLDISR